MLFEWNEQVIKWQLSASEYTGYHRKMAELLKKYITSGSELCDMGCGMALSDFYLAPGMKSVTCVDVDANALAYVSGRAKESGLENVRTIMSDGLKAEGEWDTVIALFHSAIELMGSNYLGKARNNLVIVTHGNTVGTTGPEKYRGKKCCSTMTTKAWLDAHGWKYTVENAELEFGQPHKSFGEAIAWTSTFCPSAPVDELRAHVEKTVVHTGNPEFPFYTPKVRSFGIFNIPRYQNRA